MVSITDAKQIIRLATDAEIKVFLDGGWGVDALIGYPYTMKDILEDTEKTEQKKQELENILEQYNELISIYKSRIEEMLR